MLWSTESQWMYSGTELKLLLTHGPPTHVFLLILSDWSYSQTCVGVCILWMIDIWTALLIDLLFEGDTAYTVFGIMLQSYSDLTCHVSVRSPCHHILRKGEPSFIHEQHSLKSFKKEFPQHLNTCHETVAKFSLLEPKWEWKRKVCGILSDL